MIKLIIFDYDGVIVNSFPEVHKIYLKMCAELGKNCPKTLEEFRKVYGYNSSDCYQQLGFTDKDIQEGNKIYKKEIGNATSPPFEGIKEVLEKLIQEYKLIVISSGYREDIEQKLNSFNLLKYFLKVFGRESIKIKRFEKIEAIKEALNKYKVSPDETLLIGDRNVDFVEGTKAGLNKILLVNYGWGYDLNLIPRYKHKSIVKHPQDLIESVKNY